MKNQTFLNAKRLTAALSDRKHFKTKRGAQAPL
jgi:hypothetical protein